ncbi:MAG: hypothetical protein H7Y08_03325 [Rhizobiaceae bacterium]|nr:hypothetical protein [Rhizobiaceae bacterium]
MAQAAKPIEVERDALEDDVDGVLRIGGGDTRKAVLGPLLGQRLTESELSQIVSAGYVRKRLH